MFFFLKYIVTLFYKKLKIKIVVSFLRKSGPRVKTESALSRVGARKSIWSMEIKNTAI